jgi:hypothetical protein
VQIDWYERLANVANELDQTRIKTDAEVGYDVLSDGIVWSDEYPPNLVGRTEEFDCVRILLRYRTSVLTGSPDEYLRPYWEFARTQFPNWAGFDAERNSPSPEMQKFRERSERRDTRLLKVLFQSRGE